MIMQVSDVNRRKIIICYLRAGSSVLEDHILNRLAAKLAPRYGDSRDPVVHVEMFFPDESNPLTGLSAGICYGGQVFMHPKQFSRPNWEFHSIPVTETQLSKAKRFCDFQRGTPFNYRGFFAPSACNMRPQERVYNLHSRKMSWYCSELVSYALLSAGIMDSVDAAEASKHPNSLYYVVERECDTYIDCARNLTNKKLQL